MNKTELVKRLGVLEAFLGGDYEMGGHWFGETVAGRPYWWRAKMREYLTDAISYINATPSRDEVLEEAAAWHDAQAAKHQQVHDTGAQPWDEENGAEFYAILHRTYATDIRALKSAPNTKEAPQPEKFVPKDAGTQAQIAAVMLATGTPEQQAEVLAHMASEARVVAQPEKPGLEQEFAATLYGGQSIDQWTRIKDYETRMAIWQLIRLIDARQGEK